jgi:hypothetical protein
MLKSLIRFLTELEPPPEARQSDVGVPDTLDHNMLADLPAYHPRRETDCPWPHMTGRRRTAKV